MVTVILYYYYCGVIHNCWFAKIILL